MAGKPVCRPLRRGVVAAARDVHDLVLFCWHAKALLRNLIQDHETKAPGPVEILHVKVEESCYVQDMLDRIQGNCIRHVPGSCRLLGPAPVLPST